MSVQEHHEKKDQYFKSRTPRKKGSICQFKSTTKKRSILSNQEHHEKKGSICQIKSTTKERINMSIQEHHERKDKYVKSNVPQPSHICVIANHFDCNVRSNKSIMKIRSEEHEAI